MPRQASVLGFPLLPFGFSHRLFDPCSMVNRSELGPLLLYESTTTKAERLTLHFFCAKKVPTNLSLPRCL